MYARVNLFIISLLTFEIPDFVWFQSSKKRFLFSEPVRPLLIEMFQILYILGKLHISSLYNTLITIVLYNTDNFIVALMYKHKGSNN